MEKAFSPSPAARLHAVGVIGFVPKAHSYRPYPVGAINTNSFKATWHKNPSIHATPGSNMPISLN